MEPTTQLPAQPAVAWTDLLAAVERTLETWEWMAAESRRPLSHILRDPANEMKVFKMVISMNDVRSKYEKWKAANAADQAQPPREPKS